MTLIEELHLVAQEQHQDSELPDALLSEVLAITDAPTSPERNARIKKLITQLRSFDLYAGAGCFSESFGVREITATLKSITTGE